MDLEKNHLDAEELEQTGVFIFFLHPHSRTIDRVPDVVNVATSASSSDTNLGKEGKEGAGVCLFSTSLFKEP